MSKPYVQIYVNPTARSTQYLLKFIGKHIDDINKQLMVKIVKINKTNIKVIKKKGITRTPTLVYGKKKYVSLEKIIKIITPPKSTKISYGYGNTSAEDQIHSYQDRILNSEEDEPNESDPEVRESQIRSKMAAFQRRRPQMEGVDKRHKVTGGRKLKKVSRNKRPFNDDDTFVKASRIDQIEDTPLNRYFEQTDGDLILEDYYNAEADIQGRKHKGTGLKSKFGMNRGGSTGYTRNHSRLRSRR